MREVRIKDTLSGELTALDGEAEVGIYACGPTVYSRIHIGNARPFVVFSLLARFLRAEGYATRLVVNVTDINDKIYAAAAEAGEPSAEFAARMTEAYIEDTDRLGLGRPDAEPLASETIDGIVALIAELVEGGHAYESGGDVYFRVASFDGYGKLSNRRPEDMDQGEEAGAESLKESPLDFALWKSHKEGEDTSWDSPWGPGRPAWHIECSVMAERELGPSFAIHGGGSDLVFPHHENEIAQSEAAGRGLRPDLDAQRHDRDRRREDVEVGGQHLPALRGARPVRARGGGPVPDLRALPAAAGLQRRADGAGRGAGRAAAELLPGALGESGESVEQQRGGSRTSRLEAFKEALADDFNTPGPWPRLFELVGEANREEAPGAAEALREMLELLGLESLAEAEEGADEEAEALLAEREEARAAKDFERADEIRDRLAELGWEVRDAEGGARLVPKG